MHFCCVRKSYQLYTSVKKKGEQIAHLFNIVSFNKINSDRKKS